MIAKTNSPRRTSNDLVDTQYHLGGLVGIHHHRHLALERLQHTEFTHVTNGTLVHVETDRGFFLHAETEADKRSRITNIRSMGRTGAEILEQHVVRHYQI